MSDDTRWAETDRLWRAIKRDLFPVIEAYAGFRYPNDTDEKVTERLTKRATRLQQNWEALCRVDLDVATGILHGIEQATWNFPRHGEPYSPGDQANREMDELVGLVTKGREANPETKVETVGELVDLGEQAIRREVEEDLE